MDNTIQHADPGRDAAALDLARSLGRRRFLRAAGATGAALGLGLRLGAPLRPAEAAVGLALHEVSRDVDAGIPGSHAADERCAVSADAFAQLWPGSRPLGHDFALPGNRPQLRLTATAGD